ncbi:NnrS family protein [Sedimentitalea sp. HM32M-2]|uniref:NnrS family protein n=1 Tax=Sedimentitalea sp. HM32M-2 TaxID=3351566 RepID=UPI0036345687
MRQPPRLRVLAFCWDAPHKPLFLASVLCALMAVAWWPLGVRLGVPAPALDPLSLWHAHELIFGFGGAAVGGYLLTALPSWTGAPPLNHAPLMALTAIWVLARATTALAEHLPQVLLIAANAGYFFGLGGIIGYQLVAAGACRKLGFCLILLLMGALDGLILGNLANREPAIGARLLAVAPMIPVILMVLVGSRAIPAFARNWLLRTGQATGSNAPGPASGQPAIAAVSLAAGFAFAGWQAAAGIAEGCAAILLVWQMRRWPIRRTMTNPLLAALHLGFCWLPAGLALSGWARLFPGSYPAADAVHAITIGAMSGLIMAFAARAAAHRGGGDLRARSGFRAGFLLLWSATWVRLAVPLFADHSAALTGLAGVIWCAGWGLFLPGFLAGLAGPVRRPVLSGKKHPQDISHPATSTARTAPPSSKHAGRR